MDLGLVGVPAAVAGASRGLGYATALELAREGAEVFICSRDGGAAEGAATAIQGATGAEVRGVAADVSTPEGAEGFIEAAVEKMGGLQVLITNSGGPPPSSAAEAGDGDWLGALDLNFLSAVRLVRSALPHLRSRAWGRIVCITSVAAKQPVPNLALSNSARAATTAFAKTLAEEVAGSSITVNCVMPGQILTDRLRTLSGAPPDAGSDHPAFKDLVARIPAGRIGSPEEFAAAVTFLCSERASFVNGVALQVDGGFFRGLF
ncbi:MAG: SDR family oxidoreductase [Actinomycetota bacterium]